MRRFAAALLPLLVAATPTPAGPTDLQDIQTRGTLRVVAVLDPSRPEFFATKAGLPPGFDQEILKGFADLHRLSLQVVAAPSWDELIPTLLAGKADVIAGRFTVTEHRRKSIAFTSEVFPYRLVVITRKPGRVVASIEDLRREKVGTMKGTNMAEVIATLDLPPENLDDTIPPGGFVDALRSGRVGAVVWGVESAIASQKDDPAIQLGTFVGPPGSLAFGVRKTDPALLAALNDYVDNFRRSPSWSRLVVKYFGADAPAILKNARGE